MSRLHDFERKLDEKIRGTLRSREQSSSPPELVEVERAILQDVVSHVDFLPRGNRKWSYPQIHVRVLTPEARRRSYEIALVEADALQRRIRARLQDEDVELPARFQAQVILVDSLPEDVRAKGFDIYYDSDAPEPSRPRCTIEVLAGTAIPAIYESSAKRVNLGRLPEVLDGDQQFVRRNDIAFTDNSDPVNASVSRQHAHLAFDPESGWRLFDDRSKSGTTILRAGEVLRVPAGSARGVALKIGDEIRLGKARLHFS